MKRLVFLVIGLSLIWGFTSAQSLVNINGDWLFHYAENIEKADSIANSGFYRVDYDATNFQKTPVPSCWAILGYEEPIYRGFKKQNDLASEGFYIHRFTLPESFNGKKVWLHFGGVWASAEVWMNGVWVGRHDSGYTSFHLDVTSEAKTGKENVLAVRVRQVYPGYECDTYDDWTLGGIYRDVTLEAMPRRRWIDKLTVVTDFDIEYTNADMKLKVMVGDSHKNTLPGNYRSPGKPYALQFTLTDKDGEVIVEKLVNVDAHISTHREVAETFQIIKPHQWNAETPYLYNLKVDLLEDGQVVQTKTQKVGFREISTDGGVFRINGQAVKLRGVNYHDEYPTVGRATRPEHWLKDLKLMKEANINYIRACHYQHAKGIIEMCDSLGFYVGGEISLGGAGNLMQEQWMTGAVMQRTAETVERDLNNPSIIYWSVGNEDALTNLFQQTSKLTKALDPTRPILLPWNADETLPEEIDILAPHYWTAAQYDSIASRSSRPIITTEYVHAYGNQRFGGLDDCWKALHRHPAGAGGAVWVWADQGILTPTKKDPNVYKSIEKDNEYLRVGPEGWDGIVDSYRKPMRDYWEVKAVYAPVYPETDVVTLDNKIKTVSVPIHNDYDFLTTADVKIDWKLFVDETLKDSGTSELLLHPHETKDLTLNVKGVKELVEGETAYLQLSFKKAGHEISLRSVELKPKSFQKRVVKSAIPSVEEKSDKVIVSAGDATYTFNRQTGMVESVSKAGKKVLKAFRPTVWHELNDGDQIIKNRSFKKGVDPERYAVDVKAMNVKKEKESVVISSNVVYTIDADNHFTADYVCIIGKDGKLQLSYTICPQMQPSYLPVVGMAVQAKKASDIKRWFGLGPDDAYPNKKTATILGMWNMETMEGTRASRWVEIGSEKGVARITNNAFIDRDSVSSDEIRLVSEVLGRSEKGRLNDVNYQVYPTGSYSGTLIVELR